MDKRRINLFTAILTLLGCVSAMGNPITPQQALRMASEYVVPGQKAELRHKSPVRRPTTQTAPYYVFSRGEGQGGVFVAGDDCIPAIIGYTESGDFDESREAPQLLALLNHYADIVELLQEKGLNHPYRQVAAGPAKARANISPMLTTHWHQSSPYNDRVPKMKNGERALTGCVATAGAQVFYFWRRDMPITLPSTTPTYDYGDAPATEEYQLKRGTPLKWELMCDSYGSQPAEYKDAVAVLNAAIGMQTYLTYGASTGGYIWQLPFGEYNLTATQADKVNGFTDDTWSALIYSDLKKGYPVIYSGYDENWEGHAIVIDGYRANGDLFHFNYGWGGQSDGYYTVMESGDNNIYYSVQPTVMHNIHPIRYNLEADIVLPVAVYASGVNDVGVKVTNHSSVSRSGIYLFTNTSGKNPTTLSSAFASDEETEIAPNQTVSMHFSQFVPTSESTWHLFVTDGDLNILGHETVEPQPMRTRLKAGSLRIDGNAEEELHGGINFTVVYNSRGAASAEVRNDGGAGYEGSLYVNLSSSDDEGATWNYLGRKIGKLSVPAHGSQRVIFGITNTAATPVKEGILYRVALVPSIPDTADSLLIDENADTVAYFVVKSSDLKVTSFENGVVAFSGHWDPTVFDNIIKRATYKDARIYDLTDVIGVAHIAPTEHHPNALYKVSDEAAEAEGDNVVSQGQCLSMVLMPGHDFMTLDNKDLFASSTRITFGNEAARWYVLTPPFAVDVPDGVYARSISNHDNTGITQSEHVTHLEPGRTYLLMASHRENTTLRGEQTTVVPAPVVNADPSLVGTFIGMAAPERSMLLTDGESFTFAEEGAQVEALRGYFEAGDLHNRLRIGYEPLDVAYLELAQGIEEAYNLLDRYADVADEDAREAYLDAIRKAESEFTHRPSATLTTVAGIRDYVAQLRALGDEYLLQAGNNTPIEVDMTSKLRNPSFELKSTVGWTFTVPLTPNLSASSVARVFQNSNYNYFTVDADGSYILNNSYQYATSTGERQVLGVGISQQVTGLLPGYYRLSVLLASDEDNEMTAFAGDSTVTVRASSFGKHYFTEAVVDRVKVEAGTDGMGELTVGVKEGSWYKADHFRLTYLGAHVEDGSTVDIQEMAVVSRRAPQGIYTLQGQRIGRITAPGIYIINGKKVSVAVPNAAIPFMGRTEQW